MPRRPIALIAAAAAAAATGATAAVVTAETDPPSTVAIIGDTPYGAAQLEALPSDVAAINADPDVSLVMHLGDIKNGATPCTDEYFAQIRAAFDAFQDPLVYTPGDNEWTDCHRAEAGGYLPTDRLARLRRLFFDPPGTTLGIGARKVRAQLGFPENVRFLQSAVQFGVLHIPGSDDDEDPWFDTRTDANGQPVPETPAEAWVHQREVANRRAADLRWIDSTFAAARNADAAAVVLATQADMFEGAGKPGAHYRAYVSRITKRAKRFGRPVLLLNGDSHVFRLDHPFDGAPNVARITVNGSASCPHEYLRLPLDPASKAPFSFERVPLPSSSVICP